MAAESQTARAALMREIRARHPRFREALAADARVTALHRGERHEFRSPLDAALQILRLAWVSDAFLAQVALPGEGADAGARRADAAAARAPAGDAARRRCRSATRSSSARGSTSSTARW